MNRPIALAGFERLSPGVRASWVDGLATAIDAVAARAPPSHRFLTHGWYAAAIAAYGGRPRTLVVEALDHPALALPTVAIGPAWLGMAAIPGSYWPFRSFPLALDASAGVASMAVRAVASEVRGLRIGPVHDDDPAAQALIAAARARGWAVLDRFVAQSWLLDLKALGEAWPRGSTLRKNRFHERHLADHGALEWRFLAGGDWPAAFDALAEVERLSWIASRTDGGDAKFTADGHGAFWRAAAADPQLAAMMRGALLTIDGRPAAFSFDLDAGSLRYAVANSYDPAVARHSPGKLLQYRNLIAARARGIAWVDWGAGDSGYKQVIGAEAGPAIRDWLLLRPGLPALAGRALRSFWRRSGQRESE